MFRMPGLVLTASAGLDDDQWHTISVSLSASGTVLSVDNGRVNVSSSNIANFDLSNITLAMYQGANNGRYILLTTSCKHLESNNILSLGYFSFRSIPQFSQ